MIGIKNGLKAHFFADETYNLDKMSSSSKVAVTYLYSRVVEIYPLLREAENGDAVVIKELLLKPHRRTVRYQGRLRKWHMLRKKNTLSPPYRTKK